MLTILLISISILCLFFITNPYQIIIYLIIITLFLLSKGLFNSADLFVNFFFWFNKIKYDYFNGLNFITYDYSKKIK